MGQATRKPFASAFSADDIPGRVRARFWSKVDQVGPDECWLWTMSVGNHGYGQMGWTEDEHREAALAHRMAFVLSHGPIPSGLVVDHICHVRRCCNPAHLRLLDNLTNAKANAQSMRTHCKRGHKFTEANTRLNRLGHRYCRTCASEGYTSPPITQGAP